MAQDEDAGLHCSLCQRACGPHDIIPGEIIHDPYTDLVREQHPAWTPEQHVCISCLHACQSTHLQATSAEEDIAFAQQEAELADTLRSLELSSRNRRVEWEAQRTPGERVSDTVAAFVGSWTFLLIVAVILIIWVGLNTVVLLIRPFDPYPFIFLNLVLSLVAALQAPLILMSQNRQDARDRARSEHDYRVNLRAELEIRHLHWKLDQLLTQRWQHLLQMQEQQIALMEHIVRRTPPP